MRILDGLTALESVEFLLLDATVPFDGAPVWPSQEHRGTSSPELRWMELWEKHCNALRQPERPQSLLLRAELNELRKRAAKPLAV